ncbi:hypothetical protein B7R21_03635 [Subtercola boreus]|uniref:Uncharacterized protein n=1 Tax=Subtercola boreus TaxID=120213 RepID=A0A3E0W0X9_9MICO|nr:hypothetical protein [Subtercola boreus]RFA15806.1 hypothetical protein B7R21_03635 [Subtercola boreus]
MSASGRTAQEIDPLSGITARIFAMAVGCVAVISATTLTLLNPQEIGSPPLMLLAFVALVAGFGHLVWAADPFRRTVTRARYGITYGLVLVAAVLESLAQLGRDTDVRNDWGPIAVALVLMVSGSYRRPREIVVGTVIAALVVAGTTVLHSGTVGLAGLVGATTMSGTLVVALGGGAAIFAASLIAGLRAERRRSDDVRRNRNVRDRRRAIEEFLGTDIEALRREVLPFFRDLKLRDALTDGDRQQAAELARLLRSSLARRLADEPLEGLVGVFDDPLLLAAALNTEQRTALRTVLSHFAGLPGRSASDLSLVLGRGGVAGGGAAGGAADGAADLPAERMTGELVAAFGAERGPTAGIAPFVGLMQLAFPHVDAHPTRDAIVIRFDF